jgi:protein involved in polysaccharide export with SLBB domain
VAPSDDPKAPDHGSARFEPAPPSEHPDSPIQRREIQLTAGTATLSNVELTDGDLVTVERRDPPSIVVTGLVIHPGRFEMPIGNDYRILDAIAAAGGVSYKVLDTVLVCRQVPNENKRAIIQISLRAATRNQGENILLAPEDVVSVEANPRVLAQDVIDFIGSVLLGAAPLVIH